MLLQKLRQAACYGLGLIAVKYSDILHPLVPRMSSIFYCIALLFSLLLLLLVVVVVVLVVAVTVVVAIIAVVVVVILTFPFYVRCAVALQQLREILANPECRTGKNSYAADNAISAMLHIAKNDKHGTVFLFICPLSMPYPIRLFPSPFSLSLLAPFFFLPPLHLFSVLFFLSFAPAQAMLLSSRKLFNTFLFLLMVMKWRQL